MTARGESGSSMWRILIRGIQASEGNAQELCEMVMQLLEEEGQGKAFFSMRRDQSPKERRISLADERLIRQRLRSAARSRVADYPRETLRQLLDDARGLADLLDWERDRRGSYPDAADGAHTVEEELQPVVALEELNRYEQLTMAHRRAIVLQIVGKLASNPHFRWWIEDELRKRDQRDETHESRRRTALQLARMMFTISRDSGWIWVWIHGLKTYGEGDSWAEARNDTLEEIGYTLDELWEADRQ